MVESVFQTLLLLAYFDIALISITIANYAVSASFLGRESRLSRRRMEKRKEQLDEKVKELQTKGLPIKQLKGETQKAEDDIKVLGRRIILLSWLGAVVLPSVFFFISFVFSVLGMNIEILSQEPVIQEFVMRPIFILSSGFLAVGFMVLLLVIWAIDSAAKKIPIPEFEVCFEKQTKATKCKRNERINITLCITNKGEDIAENLQIFVMFPPAFKVHGTGEYTIFKQDSESDCPDYNAAIFQEDLIHIDTTLKMVINLTPPDEKKVYDIPISIYEIKMGVSDHKLSIEVVD